MYISNRIYNILYSNIAGRGRAPEEPESDGGEHVADLRRVERAARAAQHGAAGGRQLLRGRGRLAPG